MPSNLAKGLETREVIVGHDCPLRDHFIRKLNSFEIKTTSVGNTVLYAQATEHKADLLATPAIALHISNAFAGFTSEGWLPGL